MPHQIVAEWQLTERQQRTPSNSTEQPKGLDRVLDQMEVTQEALQWVEVVSLDLASKAMQVPIVLQATASLGIVDDLTDSFSSSELFFVLKSSDLRA